MSGERATHNNTRRANRNQASPLEAERLRFSFDVCDVNRPASLVEPACNFYIFPSEPRGLRPRSEFLSLEPAKVFPDWHNLTHEHRVPVYGIVYMGLVFRSIPEIQKLVRSTIY